ncbi:fructosamine kinase family protein [Blastococcus sp. Marseille-P5729]|uniref:fructosamine kinase family protein n=1 Tax=Blastococcus sp. Marseille-P5729 TaxID=2086582 RepID=UPI000D0FEB0B|nr:fructosamine kinase family protein [Blastococcus sp. Marseille-P5729]
MGIFRKSGSTPPRYFAWEAAGLRWLAEGPTPVVDVLDVGEGHLDLVELGAVAPTPEAAEEFGRRLAQTHDLGAPAYGAPPPGWSGPGYFGPADDVFELPLAPYATWSEHYAHTMIEPLAERTPLPNGVRSSLRELTALIGTGELDTGEPPARIHGDLWSGNLMWTADGATLIDPAAHGGHREADLAMLALFGAPHLERIVAAYDEQRPLADGWQDRVAVHQVFALLAHVALFGSGYLAMLERAILPFVGRV